VAYVHVSDQRRTKLDDKSKKYIYIGYDEKTKAFKLFDPVEKSAWYWKNQKEMTQKEEKREPSTVTPMITSTITQTSDDEEEPRQPKMRSLQDLYESTSEVHLVCLLADTENRNKMGI
jgi:hypothetical protein